jgi:hypothetical protein
MKDKKLIRGFSLFYDVCDVRVANRGFISYSSKDYRIGFRVCLSIVTFKVKK